MMPLLLSALIALGPGARRSEPPTKAGDAQPPLSDEEIRARIDAYLGSIDTPIPASQWRALGPKAGPMLEEKAADHGSLPSRRAKALDGLAAVGSPGAPQLFMRLAQAEDEPLVVRLSAIHGAEKTLRKDRLAPALRPVLEGAKSPHLRRAAAEALSRHGGCALVRAQARKEDDAEVLGRAVSRCERE